MPDSYQTSSVKIIRRQPKSMPSVRRNIFRAIGLLILLGALFFLSSFILSDPKDAIAEGQIELEPLPTAPETDPLETHMVTLPDLLDGVVPKDKNPTDAIDALGNTSENRTILDAGLAGGNSGIANRPDQPIEDRPKTILINGEPLGASPLKRAPFPGLTRTGPFGQLPRIGPNNVWPVKAYARPFRPKDNHQQISIILGGMGVNPDLTRRAIYELPPDITLSFAAHSKDLQNWIHQARAQGHEVILELPMESASRTHIASQEQTHMLKTNVSAANNIRNLDWLMGRAQGYFALTNYNGDQLLKRTDVTAPIMAHMADAGVGFIFDRSAHIPSLNALAQSSNLPFTSAFALIDQSEQAADIRQELSRLETEAQSGTRPIGVGFAYMSTIDTLKDWVQILPERNLQLAPASYVLNGSVQHSP